MAVRADVRPYEHVSLAELLRCPYCGSRVSVGDTEVECLRTSHRFAVVEGVVVMIDEHVLESDPQYATQRAFFAREFAAYRSYRPANWRRSYLSRLRAARLLDAGPLIDVGVGASGHTVIEAARLGLPAVGCDLSLEALVRARRFAVDEGVAERTLWICCSAERLPFELGSFSAALAIAVLEHVPDDRAALSEAARVLRPGGRLWVTVPHSLRHIAAVWRAPNRRHDRRLGHLRRYEARDLVWAARAAGLTPIEVEYTGHPVKLLQLAAGDRAHGFWWWCERRDLARARVSRGSMQLSALFERS